MKLYFYFLNAPYNVEPFVSLEECEVIEKAKTYYPVDKFPNGFFGSYVRKADIGRLIGYNSNIVILTEHENNTALDVLEKKTYRECKRLEDKLYKERAKLIAIENFR